MAGFRLAVGRGSSWDEARSRLKDSMRGAKKRMGLAVRRAALLAEREIKKGLVSGAPGGQVFKPLAALTKLLRRGRKPLLDTGSLLGSITTTFSVDGQSAFVGVHRTARRPDGTSQFNVAVVHEFGSKPFTIPVTDGVRRFFWAMSLKTRGRIRPLSPAKTVILHPGVPARPFIRPVMATIQSKLQKEIKSTLEGVR